MCPSKAQWVVNGYMLMLGALILVGGSAGDRFGRRRVFASGIAVFTAASIGCGFAPNVTVLIAARVVQGVGGALLVPVSLAIISAAFPAPERGKAVGTWAGFAAIAAALGPVLGGWLVDTLSWRAIFFIAFIWREARASSPMLPFGLFRSMTFSGANLMTLLLYFALSGAFFFL